MDAVLNIANKENVQNVEQSAILKSLSGKHITPNKGIVQGLFFSPKKPTSGAGLALSSNIQKAMTHSPSKKRKLNLQNTDPVAKKIKVSTESNIEIDTTPPATPHMSEDVNKLKLDEKALAMKETVQNLQKKLDESETECQKLKEEKLFYEIARKELTSKIQSNEEYKNKTEEEIMDLRKNFFFSIAIAIKLNLLHSSTNSGTKFSNVDIGEIWTEAVEKKVNFSDFPTFVTQKFANFL